MKSKWRMNWNEMCIDAFVSTLYGDTSDFNNIAQKQPFFWKTQWYPGLSRLIEKHLTFYLQTCWRVSSKHVCSAQCTGLCFVCHTLIKGTVYSLWPPEAQRSNNSMGGFLFWLYVSLNVNTAFCLLTRKLHRVPLTVQPITFNRAFRHLAFSLQQQYR